MSHKSPFRINGSGDLVETNSVNEMAELLIDLNRAIEGCDDLLRHVFFTAADQAGFGSVFALVCCFRSVRCVREIDEFKEMRREWDEARRQKRKWENID